MRKRGAAPLTMRSFRVTVATVAAALLTAGCVGTTDLVRALGKDPASVCVSVTTVYGKGAACRVGSEVKAGDGTISVTSK